MIQLLVRDHFPFRFTLRFWAYFVLLLFFVVRGVSFVLHHPAPSNLISPTESSLRHRSFLDLHTLILDQHDTLPTSHTTISLSLHARHYEWWITHSGGRVSVEFGTSTDLWLSGLVLSFIHVLSQAHAFSLSAFCAVHLPTLVWVIWMRRLCFWVYVSVMLSVLLAIALLWALASSQAALG